MRREICILLLSFAASTALPADRPPAIRVSKETTRLTEPLNKDGTGDYLTVVNRRAIPQTMAPEIAGISRAAFINAVRLADWADELVAEMR